MAKVVGLETLTGFGRFEGFGYLWGLEFGVFGCARTCGGLVGMGFGTGAGPVEVFRVVLFAGLVV